jgi:polar amino acid transport system substrate-binding protein
MRMSNWLVPSVFGLLLAGCANLADTPTREARAALAPTGKLRVALQQGNPLNAVRDPASGEMKGLAVELGKDLARRLDVPYEPVSYPSIGTLLAAGQAGAWDVMHVGFTPERARDFDFAPVHIEVEFSYLVPAASSLTSMQDIDRPGVRVAVQDKSGPDAFFTRTLKNSVLVRGPSNPGALELVKSGRADVMGSIKPILVELSPQLPGARILDGRAGTDPHAMATPKGRDAGAAYLRQFIEAEKANGRVKAAIDASGLRGVVVAPAR